MLVKLTSGNRLTLPKAVIEDFPDSRYFDVTQDNGRIVLTPVRLTRSDAVRAAVFCSHSRSRGIARRAFRSGGSEAHPAGSGGQGVRNRSGPYWLFFEKHVVSTT